MTDIEKKAKDYEFDLCSRCRGCGYVYGQDKPCQHIVDAKHGFKDGYKKGFLEGCESFKKEEETVDSIETNNSKFDDFSIVIFTKC